MQQIQIPFAGGEFEARAPNVNAQRTINLYPEVTQSGGKNKIVLYSTPGLNRQTAMGVGPIRSNGVQFKDKLYFVSKNELYSIDTSNTATKVGTLNTENPRCIMAAGRDYLMVVDGTNGYTWDDSTFSVISDGDYPDSATHVTYLDGYFIVNEAGSDEWKISANEDPTSWDALDFATASSRPDDVLAHQSYDGDLYMVGEQTVEIYDNTGNEDFPFERYPNGILDYGIEAPFSIAGGRSGLFWLGRTQEGAIQVLQAAGLQVQPVSNPSLENEIEGLIKTDDAIGWVYAQSGHTFFWMTFPTANRTFVLDVGNGLWHERQYGASGRHRANGHGYLDGSHYVGDYESGNIYTLDLDKYTDNGEEIHRIRRSPVVHKDRKRMFVHAIEVEFEAGVGLTTGQGSDPQAMLQISKDGGHTWTDEIWRPIGKIGEYNARTMWRKMGIMRDFIVELTVTDPIPVTMIAAYAQIDVANT